MHLHISHETVYDYDAPVARSTQYLRLTPRAGRGLRVLHWHLELPAPASACKDAFGNTMHVLSLDGPRRDIVLRAVGEVDTSDAPPTPDPEDELPAPLFLRDSPLTRADEPLRQFAASFADAATADAHSALLALMAALGERMPYVRGYTDAATPAAQAFATGHGVCQDHAQVFVCCARLLGLPARYVSGYLATDFEHVASHAWAEAYVEGLGWVSFDPANAICATDLYVRVAVGLDYLEAAPVRGSYYGAAEERLEVRLKIDGARQAQS